MAISPRLELRQGQSLVMTPQLQQAIKLLGLSNLELAHYLDAELEKNPLLERVESTTAKTVEPTGSGDGGPIRVSDRLGGSGDRAQAPDETYSQAPTLREHLMAQAQLALRDPSARLIAAHLMDMLDEAGYLVGDPQSIAALLSCPLEQVESTLAQLRQFDPVGVFACSLQECLALQLAEKDRLDPAMELLLANLPLLAKGKMASLRRRCGVDEEDLAEMIQEVRALNPKPAGGFDNPPVPSVTPDVLLSAEENGGWLVELNNETLPRVLVNESYHAKVSEAAHQAADHAYLSEHLKSAHWLVKALHQRANTILRVARDLVRQQDAFFRYGVEHLKPMTLKDVAEAIGMHESTVSRVTANKYLATPRGTYELRFFFTAAIAGTDGGQHSAASIRHKIKTLIDAETLAEVLSDDSIVEALRRDGVAIARRTVAKYRESMRIPSSVARRRAKANCL